MSASASRRGGLASVTLAAVAAAVAATPAGAVKTETSPDRWGDLTLSKVVQSRPLATCFWEGPVGLRGLYGTNPATDQRVSNQYPDKAATYWRSRFSLPAGARLILRGTFAHSRYMSFNAYDGVGQPFTALADAEIRPDAGSKNPFVPGARRDGARRAYTVQVRAEGQPPDGRALPNTLYVGAPDASGVVLAAVTYRIYIPDRGYKADGGAGLPAVELVLANGTHVTDTAALCAATPSPMRGKVRAPAVTADAWTQLVHQPGDNPATAPTRYTRTGAFQAFFNAQYSIYGSFVTPQQRAAMDATQKGGLYSTIHNRYAFASIIGRFGKVFTFRAKAPRTPATFAGAKRMAIAIDMRYFSVCTGESPVTGHTPDCVYDEQIPVARDGYFTIAISKPADRPRNATNRCGVAWVNWGQGEGYPGSRPDYAIVLMRHMLPRPSFKQSVFAVTKPGTEKQVMGAYYPRSAYFSKAAFEKRGCARPKYLPPVR
jgi:hypothetical protein